MDILRITENYDANWCTTEVPDDSQARAKVMLGEIPDDIPTREREDWKEKRKPKGKGKEKVTKEKLGEIPDDMATWEREDCKEKRKPKGKGKEEEEKPKPKPKPKRKPKKRKPKVLKERDRWYMDDRDQILLRALLGPELKWEEKVMDILHVFRRQGFTEYNSKMQCHVPTRFCLYNIAFFDLDKECKHILDLCSFILTLLSFPWSTGMYIQGNSCVYSLAMSITCPNA
jgi:hypothetical protein